MGSAKRYYEAMMESGRIDPRPGVHVSAACFEDDAVRRFIRKSITDQPCSYYCGRGKTPRGAPFDVVTQFIFEGLCSRYDDAAQGVGYDGGYVGATTYDSLDLYYDHLDLTGDARDGLIDDIAGALPDWTWSEIDPYAARDHESCRGAGTASSMSSSMNAAISSKDPHRPIMTNESGRANCSAPWLRNAGRRA